MKKLGILALLGLMAAGANAQFANGTIAVVSFDGGATAPVNTGMQVVLKNFTTAGALVGSMGACYVVFLTLEIMFIQKSISIKHHS